MFNPIKIWYSVCGFESMKPHLCVFLFLCHLCALQEVWTLCRILKRIPSYKKYTPNLKNSVIKPNYPTNSSSSTTCSYLTFTDSSVINQQIERKPVIGQVDERNHLLCPSQLNNAAQAPTTLSHSSFWNQNVDEYAFANDENWDDLRSVVQFATDPSNGLWLYII